MNLGRIAIVAQGDYDATRKYKKLDTVNFKDSIYIALMALDEGESPTIAPTKWMLGAGKGKDFEALYNDTPETLAGDVLKRVDFADGVDVNYREITTWYDGSTMNDSKLDNVIFIKKGAKYYKKQIDKQTLLKINTIADLRNFNGYYEGQEVTLMGYYESGDKEPLNYKWTLIQGVDDGGSVINTENGSWEAIFGEKINVRDFGAKPDGITNNTPIIQKASNIKKVLEIDRKEGDSFYLFDGKVRFYNSIIGIDNPVLKNTNKVNTENITDYFKYSIIQIANKDTESYIDITGLTLDGSWDGESTIGGEQNSAIIITSSKNVNIYNNKILNTAGDGIQIYWYTAELEPRLFDYCENINIYNNNVKDTYRCSIAVVSGKNVNIYNNVIDKQYDYVVPIDLEMDLWTEEGQLMQNIIIENNIVNAPNSENAISVLGVLNGVDNIIIKNNTLSCNTLNGRSINLDAGYGSIKNVFCYNNKVSCLLALRLTGSFGVKNVVMEKTTSVNDYDRYYLANIGWADGVIIKDCYSHIDINNQANIICGGNGTKNISIVGNNLISDLGSNIILVEQNENIYISCNNLKALKNNINSEYFSTSGYYLNNIDIIDNNFVSTGDLQVAFRAGYEVNMFYMNEGNTIYGLLGFVSNADLIINKNVYSDTNRPIYSYNGHLILNSTENEIQIFNNGVWNKYFKIATTTTNGTVKKGVSVPDGSSIDVLLASLRNAGIIES